jgi:hypothetical protein
MVVVVVCGARSPTTSDVGLDGCDAGDGCAWWAGVGDGACADWVVGLRGMLGLEEDATVVVERVGTALVLLLET